MSASVNVSPCRPQPPLGIHERADENRPSGEREQAIRPRTVSRPLGKNEEEKEREGGRSARRLGGGAFFNDVGKFYTLLKFHAINSPSAKSDQLYKPTRQCGRQLSKDPPSSQGARARCKIKARGKEVSSALVADTVRLGIGDTATVQQLGVTVTSVIM